MFVVKRYDGGDGRIPRGHWAAPNTGDPPAADHKADMCCANGHIGALRSHSVAADGTVAPSVVCPGRRDGCEFHEHARLDGWTFGALPASGINGDS